MPMPVIMDDLRLTRSVEITIENILDGRLVAPPGRRFREDTSGPVPVAVQASQSVPSDSSIQNPPQQER